MVCWAVRPHWLCRRCHVNAVACTWTGLASLTALCIWHTDFLSVPLLFRSSQWAFQDFSFCCHYAWSPFPCVRWWNCERQQTFEAYFFLLLLLLNFHTRIYCTTNGSLTNCTRVWHAFMHEFLYIQFCLWSNYFANTLPPCLVYWGLTVVPNNIHEQMPYLNEIGSEWP